MPKFLIKETEGQQKKHYSQMNDRELNGLEKVLKTQDEIRFSNHAKEREDFQTNEEEIKLILKSDNLKNKIIEFNVTPSKRKETHRVLIRDDKAELKKVLIDEQLVTRMVNTCFVYDLDKHTVITVYYNPAEDVHTTINMDRYNNKIDILEYLDKNYSSLMEKDKIKYEHCNNEFDIKLMDNLDSLSNMKLFSLNFYKSEIRDIIRNPKTSLEALLNALEHGVFNKKDKFVSDAKNEIEHKFKTVATLHNVSVSDLKMFVGLDKEGKEVFFEKFEERYPNTMRHYHVIEKEELDKKEDLKIEKDDDYIYDFENSER